MKSHFWQGTWIDDRELGQKIEQLRDSIALGHAVSFSLEEFYRACDRFSRRLKHEPALIRCLCQSLEEADQAHGSAAEEVIAEVSEFLKEASLRQKMRAEFGTDNPFRSDRVNSRIPSFVTWSPLGFLVQILAANAPSLPLLSGFEGLMTGNINFLKLSTQSGAFTGLAFEEFFHDPAAKAWKDLMIVARLPSAHKALLQGCLQEAEGVVAWGGEESLAQIRQICPPRARLIEWGHKISFAYVTQSLASDSATLQGIARDVFLFDQQACSSPQCIFLENASFAELKAFAQGLAPFFALELQQRQVALPTDMEAAELSRVVSVVRTEMALAENYTDIIEDTISPEDIGPQWRLLIDSRPGLRASPLYRTVWIKSLPQEKIVSLLRPLGQYLQTVGLACEREELDLLTQKFYQAGVTRIRPTGGMLDSYSGEPHDGVPALTRYMKKVSLEQNCGLDSFATLEDLHENKIHFESWPEKLMQKEDFQRLTPPKDASELFFKSGGSSGDAKISVFTYHDYHRQMRLAADGLLAAGLNPGQDRCMNLFFGGGLYGGFLSFFSILETLEAIQFPMSAHLDFTFVGQMIVRYKINTLLGMPSYLMQLFAANHDLLQKEAKIEKIFFGGEHFSQLQREKLQSQYKVKSILSASYGSVDMGPLGYQCPDCKPGVHHLHQSLHFLEILKPDADQAVLADETGRMVFSTHGRQGQSLLRYDLGDLGRWVPGDCPCGRRAPRFELMGRAGDIFRAAGCFLNYTKFQKTLLDQLEFSYEFQLILSNEDGLDHLTLVYDHQCLSPSHEIRDILLAADPDLNEIVRKEKSLKLSLQAKPGEELVRSPGSGKLLRVIDQRHFNARSY